MSFKYEERTRAITEPCLVGIACDNCGRALKPVAATDGMWESTSAIDALDITISGGYGQFYDGNSLCLKFCHDCAKQLLAAFPVLQKAMEQDDVLPEVP